MKYLASRRLFRGSILGLASFFLVSLSPVSAALITDPAGDFLPSYSGPQNGDLDVVSAQVFLSGSNLTFTSTQNGLVGTTAGGLYVWGIDRGAGVTGFPVIAPGVTFDAVLILTNTGVGTLRDLTDGTATAISDVIISASTITAVVPLADLPSKGFLPENYLVNLWPRSGAGGQEVISDFAPDNSDASVTVVTPEPASMATAAGALLVGISLLGRKRRIQAR